MNAMMEEQSKEYYYTKIAEAIRFLEEHYKEQPSLEAVAAEVHLSPFHFQRIFTEWVGVSPKKYLQHLSLSNAKELLKKETLFNTALDTGLSGTGRLHDLFVNIEGMTPGEFKNGGKNLQINYDYYTSYFGNLTIASTSKGICYIGFWEEEKEATADLIRRFPNATYSRQSDKLQQSAAAFFQSDFTDKLQEIKLHLKATPFQLQVWNALLHLPMGNLATYGEIAQQIGNAKASRAVGTAIGSNPVAYLIPCHRVIQSSGHIGQYHWGAIRKKAIIGWESVKTDDGRCNAEVGQSRLDL